MASGTRKVYASRLRTHLRVIIFLHTPLGRQAPRSNRPDHTITRKITCSIWNIAARLTCLTIISRTVSCKSIFRCISTGLQACARFNLERSITPSPSSRCGCSFCDASWSNSVCMIGSFHFMGSESSSGRPKLSIPDRTTSQLLGFPAELVSP